MKWAWRIAALIALAAVMVAAPWAAQTAVMDAREKLKPQKPVWEGVLSVCVVPSFPTVNLDGWLGAQCRAFEQAEGNVLVSVREMTEEGVRAGAAACSLPDILLFGTGVFDAPEELFVTMRGQVQLLPGLEEMGCAGGERYAVPLALGGYALLCNRAHLDAAGWSPEMDFEETMALAQAKQLRIACPVMPYTNPLEAFGEMGDSGGMDVQSSTVHAKLWPDFVLEKKYTFYVATQREVRRMAVLQSAGKGFDTVLIAPQAPAFTDQVLLGGVVNPAYSAKTDDALYRAEWAGRLFRHLLSEEAQRGLSQAGLFPATQVQAVYEKGTQMAQIEQSLAQGVRSVPAFG